MKVKETDTDSSKTQVETIKKIASKINSKKLQPNLIDTSPTIKKVNESNLTEDRDLNNLNWQPARESSDFKTLHIDVNKLDDSWQKDKGAYIGGGGSGGIRNRYNDFGKWMKSTDVPIKTPEVGLNYKGHISFSNGRHRFSYLRDNGVKTLPVTVPTEDHDEIKKRFGV